jgi:hypothetical protein
MTAPTAIPTYTELLQAYRKQLLDLYGKICPPSWVNDIINAALAVPPPPADSGQALKFAAAYNTGSTAADATGRGMSKLSSSIPSLGWRGQGGESAQQAFFSLSAQAQNISSGLRKGHDALESWANDIIQNASFDREGYSQLQIAATQLALLLHSPIKDKFAELAILSIRLKPVVEQAIWGCETRLAAFQFADKVTNDAIQALQEGASLIPIPPHGPTVPDPLSAVRNEYPVDSAPTFPNSPPPVSRDPERNGQKDIPKLDQENGQIINRLEADKGQVLAPVEPAKIAK